MKNFQSSYTRLFVVSCLSWFAGSFVGFATEDDDVRQSLLPQFGLESDQDPSVAGESAISYKVVKKRRRQYHKQNKARHGNRYMLAVELTKVAAQLMEKPFDSEKSFVAGLNCLVGLRDDKFDEAKLGRHLEVCRSILYQSKVFLRMENRNYVTRMQSLREASLARLKLFITEKFGDRPALVRHLSQRLHPHLDCFVYGARAGLAYVFGGSMSFHTLVCESQLGRRKIYGSYDLAAGVGMGFFLTKNIQSDGKAKDRNYKKKALRISYDNLENHRTYATLAGAVGIGVALSNDATELYEEAPELGVGVGVLYSLGFGALFHIKHLTPNFESLFTLLDLGFDPVGHPYESILI